MRHRRYTRVKPVLFRRVFLCRCGNRCVAERTEHAVERIKANNHTFCLGGSHLASLIIHRSRSGVTAHLLLHVCGGASGRFLSGDTEQARCCRPNRPWQVCGNCSGTQREINIRHIILFQRATTQVSAHVLLSGWD